MHEAVNSMRAGLKDSMKMPQEIAKLSTAALHLSVLATNPDEDRSLQQDISKVAMDMHRAAGVMTLIGMVYEAFKATEDADERVKLVSTIMHAAVEACEEKVLPGVDRLENLVDLYKERFPETIARLHTEADKERANASLS